MPSIHLRACSYAHHAATPVLADVDLDVADDPAHGAWVGVVGANGAGKSTLLGLLAGHLDPTGGAAHVTSTRPPQLVPQVADEPTADVRAFAWDWSGHAMRLRRRLDLDPDDLDPTVGRGWSALSPGTRTRWLVAAALAAEPDLLLLDEPTNHLDGDGRAALLDALRDHRGLGLVVSHDRTLLDELTTRTIRIEGGRADLHPGSWSDASARWRATEAAAREHADRTERRLAREQERLADLRRARHGAEASARRARREAGPRESDAREVGRKVAAAAAERSIARRVAAQHSRVARAEASVVAPDRDHRGPVGFLGTADAAPAGPVGRVLATVEGAVHHGGGAVLLTDVDVAVRAGDRIRVDGRNGAGKSCLVRALLDSLPPGTPVASLPQELPPTALDAVGDLDPVARGRVLGTAARLGLVPDRVLAAGRTTPGERRKLVLARCLVEPAEVLVLDEPTNHLDLPAIEALQEALVAWRGTLVLVTHDSALADATTDTTWTVRDGRVTARATGGPSRR